MSHACHKLIAETAKGMARALYEDLMVKNDWYARWKSLNPKLGPQALEDRFVARMWGDLIPQARATLAQMLAASPDSPSNHQIEEALLLDWQLHERGRKFKGLH